ncbi:hypothetical protein K9L63_00885 [Candidatus Gracilibacteria bacterium]|nr:hypothetical protein [Candidatus Gracilibacteria bacterium]
MKISKIAFGSLALMAGFVLTSSLAHAFGGGQWGAFSEDRFNEIKQMFQNNDFESFKSQMEAKRAERQAEQVKFKESVTRTTENTANGVVMTITSTDANVVARLQAGKERMPRDNDKVQKTVENLSNGVRITMTSDDTEIVTRLQEGKAHKMGRGGKGFRKGKRGFQKLNQDIQ